MSENKNTHIYIITGVVREGRGQGEAVGARTANLDLSLAKDMPQGLYAGGVAWGDKKYHGLLYFGINSLSDEDCLEVHALDFDGDIYGKTITFTTSKYIRPPARFDSLEDLSVQVKDDLAEARRLLGI